MSEEQLKAFLEKVKADTSLQEKLKAAADSEAVLVIAKEAGFSISADDLKKATAEIEDAELEAAAGGLLLAALPAYGGLPRLVLWEGVWESIVREFDLVDVRKPRLTHPRKPLH